MTPNAINVTVEQDQAVVALTGEHEAYSADKLTRSLAGLIDEGISITVDLRQAAFVDSRSSACCSSQRATRKRESSASRCSSAPRPAGRCGGL